MEDLDMPETPVPDPVFSCELTPADAEDVEDSPVVPRLLHFKVPLCGTLSFSHWAKQFFDPPPANVLVMAEQLNRSTGHIHMQGLSSKSDRQVKRLREDGISSSGKYMSITKAFKIPQVIVFSNICPD